MVEHTAGEDPVLRDAVVRCQRPDELIGVVVVPIDADSLRIVADVHDMVLFVACNRTGVVV